MIPSILALMLVNTTEALSGQIHAFYTDNPEQ